MLLKLQITETEFLLIYFTQFALTFVHIKSRKLNDSQLLFDTQLPLQLLLHISKMMNETSQPFIDKMALYFLVLGFEELELLSNPQT